MTPDRITHPPVPDAVRTAVAIRIGGVCTIVGATVFGALRILHGDTPGPDASASLRFVAARPIYACVHIGAVFAALLTLGGLITLAGSLSRPGAWALGRLGMGSAVVGMTIFSVESTSEGLALPELAHASASATPQQQADLARAAQAVLAVTHGPSLVAIALLYGITLVVFGLAVVLDTYPSWLGWAGSLIGAITLISATGQYLQPDLMPGFLIYGGVLASILAQLWLITLAVVMLTRTRGLA